MKNKIKDKINFIYLTLKVDFMLILNIIVYIIYTIKKIIQIISNIFFLISILIYYIKKNLS